MKAQDALGRKISLLNDDLPRLSNLPPISSHTKASRTLPLPLARSQNSSSSSSSSSSSASATSAFTPPALSRTHSDSSSDSKPSPGPHTPCSSTHPDSYQAPDSSSIPSPSSLARRPRLPSLSSRCNKNNPMDPTFPIDGSWNFPPNLSLPAFDASIPTHQLHHQPPTSFDLQAPLQAPPILQQQQPQPAPPPPQQQIFPSAVTAQKSSQKKNNYPCPVAKQYNCSEFFTTSGHAARHAKKHTGKKDAVCPECGKAFTRKDNMEQHRRTHANGRNATGNNGASAAAPANTAKPQQRDLSEETKARRQRVQQRKVRPASISTNASAAVPAPVAPIPNTSIASVATAPTPAQPAIAQMALPVQPSPDFELAVDPQLRDSPTSSGFFPSSAGTDMSMQYPPAMPQLPPAHVPQMQQVMLPQAPMPAQPLPNGQMMMACPPEPISPLAPALDTLALAASRQQ